MILNLLDTPIVSPQVMAFLVNDKEIHNLRRVLQTLIEKNDWRPVHEIGIQNRQKLHREIQHIFYRVQTKWLLRFCEPLVEASQHISLGSDLSSVIQDLKGKTYIDMRPWTFFNIAQSALDVKSAVKLISNTNDQSLQFIMRNRLMNLAECISEYKNGEPPNYNDPGPFDGHIDDVVFKPELTSDLDYQRFEKQSSILGQISSYHLIESLVGPYTLSQGPGPFLGMPIFSQDLIDKKWKVHDFFSDMEQDWLFPSIQLLEKNDLEKCRNWLESVGGPSLEVMKKNIDKISKDEEDSLLGFYWPKYLNRFKNLVEKAMQNNQSIILLENDLSHPFWTESDWPEKIKK